MMDSLLTEKFSELKKRIINDVQLIPRIGLEVEMCVYDSEGNPALPGKKLTETSFTDVELGANQLEMRTEPIQLTSLKCLEEELQSKEEELRSMTDLKLVRIGAIPNLSVNDVQVTDKEKYHVVPKYHDDNRGSHINTVVGGINFDKAKCVSLFNSTQFNIQADGLEDAVDKLNRSLMISPYLVAISGNARIINNIDTGIKDIRMMAWEVSHDTRSMEEVAMNKELRVGMPNDYFKSIDDYFRRCSSHPLILENSDSALEICIGIFWLDTRIKFINDKPIVEYRAMSVQPSPFEDVAMAAFYIGRLAFSQLTNEKLISMESVKKNRDSAMRHGLDGELICNNNVMNAVDALRIELDKAREGLIMIGYDAKEIDNYLGILYERVDKKEVPADKFSREFKDIGINALL